jgi:hypothetical protein
VVDIGLSNIEKQVLVMRGQYHDENHEWWEGGCTIVGVMQMFATWHDSVHFHQLENGLGRDDPMLEWQDGIDWIVVWSTPAGKIDGDDDFPIEI